MSEDIFYVNELTKPYNFVNNNMQPTIHDCMLFVISRTNSKTQLMSHQNAVKKMAEQVEKIWCAADCCPFSVKRISELFERDAWNSYQFLLREKYLPGEKNVTQKRSHKKNPLRINDKKEPVRRQLQFHALQKR